MKPNQKKNNFVDQIQKLERTIYEMNRNGGPYDINLQNEQNSNSLFSKTNEPIIIPEHPHPLINCFNQERINNSSIWICDNCGCKYKCSVPSSVVRSHRAYWHTDSDSCCHGDTGRQASSSR